MPNNKRDPEQRVVITGAGVVTPLAETVADFGQRLLAGQSAITRWRKIDPRCASKIGGDLSGFELPEHFERLGQPYPKALADRACALVRSTPRAATLATAAALQAYNEAGFVNQPPEPHRFAQIMGGHDLHLSYFRENFTTYDDEPDFIEPMLGMHFMDTDVVAVLSDLLSIQGTSFVIGGACASGNMAVMSALDLLRAGRADTVLVSSVSIEMEPVILHALAMLDAITVRSFNDEPQRASRPFDKAREGFVPSDGAAAMVLETLASARRRDATIRAEVLGAAATSDARRHTRPNPAGQVRSMRDALADAGVAPEEIDYINAHATSTPIGDAAEISAIKAVWGDHAYRIPVNSTKSLVGHCLTASSLVELVATMVQMEAGYVHPTLNQENPDPELDLDFVPNVGRPHNIRIALSNGFGFGGLNSSVVIGQAP